MALKEGDSVKNFPEYSQPIKTSEGSEVVLSNFIGQSPVVLFFYPKAATPGCTKEACAFRDDYSSFSGKAKLFGISNDSVDANGKFQQAQKLPYPLLSDESGKLRKAFGIKGNLLGLIPGRQTFVIDKEGIVIRSFTSQLDFKRHVKESLAALDKAATA